MSQALIDAFVINLKHETKRKALMQEHFGSLGTELHFIEAIDTTQAFVSDTEKHYHHQLEFRHLTEGEVACFKSHQKALQAFLDTDKPYALILEDDALPVLDFNKALTQLVAYANDHAFDLINLSGKKGVYFWKRHTWDDNAIIRYSYCPTCAAAYMVSRRAATQIVRMPILASYDVQLQFGYITKIQMLHLLSPICTQNPDLQSCIDAVSTHRRQKSRQKRKSKNLLYLIVSKIGHIAYKRGTTFLHNIEVMGLGAALFAWCNNLFKVPLSKLTKGKPHVNR